MNGGLTDLVIQYALALAGTAEDYRERELGPIHLLKYVYLADLASATQNEGTTATGAIWKFWNFGPWCPAVMDRIEPATSALGAMRRTFDSGGAEKEGVRYRIAEDAERIAAQIELKLPHVVASALKRAVREFHGDTHDLLDFVYKTEPMRRAKPGEILSFNGLHIPGRTAAEPSKHYTVKQQKKRQQHVSELRGRFQERLKGRSLARKIIPTPRYDQVFESGVAWLDSQAGEDLEEEGELIFDDSIWGAGGRRDPEIP